MEMIENSKTLQFDAQGLIPAIVQDHYTKEVLTLDPDNRAALKAQRLAENERKILQDEYFAHAEKAMDNLRSAKENAAAPKTESAAEGRNIRFSIQKDAGFIATTADLKLEWFGPGMIPLGSVIKPILAGLTDGVWQACSVSSAAPAGTTGSCTPRESTVS